MDGGAQGGAEVRDAGLVSSQDYERQQLGALSLATLEDPQFALPAEDPFAWSFCRRSGMLKPPRVCLLLIFLSRDSLVSLSLWLLVGWLSTRR